MSIYFFLQEYFQCTLISGVWVGLKVSAKDVKCSNKVLIQHNWNYSQVSLDAPDQSCATLIILPPGNQQDQRTGNKGRFCTSLPTTSGSTKVLPLGGGDRRTSMQLHHARHTAFCFDIWTSIITSHSLIVYYWRRNQLSPKWQIQLALKLNPVWCTYSSLF